MSRRKLRKELDVFGETWNDAWQDNWGFRPYTQPDLDTYAADLQLVFDKHWFMVAEKIDTGESVGIAITVPDINQVLKKMNGRILPFGWWHFLRRGQDHGPRPRRLPRGQEGLPAHRASPPRFYIEHFNIAAVSAPRTGASRAGFSRTTTR